MKSALWRGEVAIAGAMLCAAACATQDGSTGPEGNPPPVLATLTPSVVSSGGPGFTLTAVGSRFVPGSVIRWDGVSRATLYVSATELTAPVSAAEITAGRVVNVSVFTPPPGGGESSALPFTIGHPVPFLTSVSPSTVAAGGAAFTLTVSGTGFSTSSLVRWDGSDRPTTVVSAAELRAEVSQADITQAGTRQVTVHTPAPGGGTSQPVELSVLNPSPAVATLSPAYGPKDGGAFALTVNGNQFVAASVVRWDGANRPTTFVSRTRLTASIPASDLAQVGTVQITVVSPGPGGGESPPVPFTVGITSLAAVSLEVNDIVYDSTRNRIYGSVVNTDVNRGNSIAKIDPATGAIEATVFVGSDPRKLAIADNGEYLYVGLQGAAAVRRVNLATFTADIQFALGSDGFLGPFYVEDMEVVPGAPSSIAVSRMNNGFSPRHTGVAIYDDGVMRPTTTPGHTGSNVIEFSATPTTLYGYNNETTDFGLRRMAISSSGVTVTSTVAGVISGFFLDIAFAGGLVYATSGAVVNPTAGTLVGTINATGFVRPDAANTRVFFLAPGTQTIRSFSTTTFTPMASLTVPGVGGATGSLIRWGPDGLAFRTSGQIVVLKTSLVTP